jgi:hypothetical protein
MFDTCTCLQVHKWSEMKPMLENAWIVGTTRRAYILQMLVSHEQGGLRSLLL